MRLTLRTLLSYLDDTLEPSQAKLIGAKVAESEQARELMERIKQVTRRRRLTTPPASGPGGIDPNTIGEYLDNEVTPEQAAEVEQICLASDVHLAEVAACHQILTLVLGEPALVPPSSKQRMYALVKGPEAIPFRKPARAVSKPENDLSSEIEPDQDETLRLGLPAFGANGGRNFWLMVGGGVLAACLLIVAVWQLVHHNNSNGGVPIVKGDLDPKKTDDVKEKTVSDKEKERDTDKDKTKGKDKSEKPSKKDDKQPEFKQPEVIDVKVEPLPEMPYAVAKLEQRPVGKYVIPGAKESAVLLQVKSEKGGGWARINGKNAPVSSARPLVSMPGSRSEIALDTGVSVMLWGNIRELTLDDLLWESRATLYVNDSLDADITLARGRLVVRNDRKDNKDALVRVRFDNPTLSQEDHVDMILTSGAAVVFERFNILDRDEPFYENSKDPLRKGPTAYLKMYSFGKASKVRFGELWTPLDESHPMLEWQSVSGRLSPAGEDALPAWMQEKLPMKDKDYLFARDKALKAHLELSNFLEKRPEQIDVVLQEMGESARAAADKETKGPSIDTVFQWRFVLRCQAALDNAGYLFDEFRTEKTPIYVRIMSMQTLQYWLALHRDHDYQLLEILRNDHMYKKTASIKVMELFHMISSEDARKPATYQQLIENLNNDLLPIRALSNWHLLGLAPAGAKIAYDPAMPRAQREAAVDAWTALIPRGTLPPAPKTPPVKKKDKS